MKVTALFISLSPDYLACRQSGRLEWNFESKGLGKAIYQLTGALDRESHPTSAVSSQGLGRCNDTNHYFYCL